MAVEDDKQYKRITIKTNCGGVFVRDEVSGKEIKTKNQYYVKAGQLAVSKIDARNGAFGVVPLEADGAIITGNFWVYDVDPEIANIDYLILLLSSNVFVQAWQNCSNGSGNRLYLQEDKFLNCKIPMPDIDVQNKLVHRYNNTSWDVIGQGMMLRSSRPLVVFEGKTDVMYVKRALEMLKSRSNDYATLNVDFLNANGAGNVKSFIDNLKSFVPDSKKIIIFFDRDNAGKDGAKAVTGISRDDEKVVHYQDIVQNNITTSFIPYKTGVTDGDFLIEDYFSWDSTIKAIVEDVIPERKHPIKMLPNLPDKIKKELEKRINQFEADEFNGFIPLLDKIVELTKEQAV